MASITVYGAPWCPDCKRSKTFLNEHRIAYNWVDIDADDGGRRAVEEIQNGGHTIPTIVFEDGSHLLEPSNEELARKLGLKLEAEMSTYDITIVGGGPAGLAASVYAAREGMTAIVVERSGLGGQAGVTERVDNYLGFPDGIGGADLAERFIAQARRYGVELLSAVSVEGLQRCDEDIDVTLSNGQCIRSHAVLLATGSSYRRLGVPGESTLIGAGVHFCATCDGPFYRGAEELMVIGGGNSALEEGLFLSQFAKKIRVVQYGPELTASRILQEKVRAHPQFEVHINAAVTELRGSPKLQEVVVKDRESGAEQVFQPAAAFVFIGLDPNTAFLRDVVDLDDAGFVVDKGGFTTSLPGVFVAGDVRRGSTKQLGSAAGDGIAALLAMRGYLEDHHQVSRRRAD